MQLGQATGDPANPGVLTFTVRAPLVSVDTQYALTASILDALNRPASVTTAWAVTGDVDPPSAIYGMPSELRALPFVNMLNAQALDDGTVSLPCGARRGRDRHLGFRRRFGFVVGCSDRARCDLGRPVCHPGADRHRRLRSSAQPVRRPSSSSPTARRPTVSISPGTSTQIEGTTQVFTVNGFDTDSDLTELWLYRGTTEIAHQLFAPTSFASISAPITIPSGGFELRAEGTDSRGRSALSVTATISVSGGAAPSVTFDPMPPASASQGATVQLHLRATDPDGDFDHLELTANGVPVPLVTGSNVRRRLRDAVAEPGRRW